jgi:hypothetical protein
MKSLQELFTWLIADSDEILPGRVRRSLGPHVAILVETVLFGFAILLTAAVARFYLPLPPQ